ncbi:MAG TPA: hypothetical protein VNH18_05085 [Bryobacteraceae bacterium]|nr:hypothetical protein [Bryobacteraceae bacterium]
MKTKLLFIPLLMAGATFAQTWRDDPYYRGDRRDYRDPAPYSDDRYAPDNRGANIVRRVISDLDRAASNSRADGHERKHFNEAVRKLNEFEDKWSRGRFDAGKLESAIDNLEHLADADRVHPRDRSILSRDLAELRQFRATRGRYADDGYNRRW